MKHDWSPAEVSHEGLCFSSFCLRCGASAGVMGTGDRHAVLLTYQQEKFDQLKPCGQEEPVCEHRDNQVRLVPGGAVVSCGLCGEEAFLKATTLTEDEWLAMKEKAAIQRVGRGE